MSINKQSKNIATVDDVVSTVLALNNSSGGEGGQSAVFEANITTEGFPTIQPHYITTADAEEIKNAFLAGKNVAVILKHNTQNPESLPNDICLHMLQYETGYEFEGEYRKEIFGFRVSVQANDFHNFDKFAYNASRIGKIEVDDNNKLCFYLEVES